MNPSWSCLPMSFAWASGIDINQIILYVGHDGSRIVWNNLPEPNCRAGFHIQELIDVMYHYDFAVTPFEALPTSKPIDIVDAHKIEFGTNPGDRLMRIIKDRRGVFTGTNIKGVGHAIGWGENQVYDPAHKIKTLDQFCIRTFWLLSKIRAD